MNAFLSLLIPGLGQFCQDRPFWGTWFFLGFIVNILLLFVIIGIITGPLWVIWSVVDAGLYDRDERKREQWEMKKAFFEAQQRKA